MGTNSEISERLATIISSEGLTPNAFAKRLGYKRAQTIYDIINGKSSPSCEFFVRFITAGFSVKWQIEWLINGDTPQVQAATTKTPENTCSLTEGRLIQLEKENERLRKRNEELIGEVALLRHEIKKQPDSPHDSQLA